MKVLGYSERGAINALLFEIAFRPDSLRLLSGVLELAMFLGCSPPKWQIASATALIEQSLSDFGDADGVLLLDHSGYKSSVFIEGKVKASQLNEWKLNHQFDAFCEGLQTKVSSSNLFAQLYHKIRFAQAARGDGLALRTGVKFPSCSTKEVRRIGTNPVVLRAVDMIAPYIGDPYYLAIVPDSPQNVRTFVAETLTPFAHDSLEFWDVSRWGFLCWSDVHTFCADEGLGTTSAVLAFNKGQIC